MDQPLPLSSGRKLRPGQRTEVWIADLDGASTLAYATDDRLLEAPNWLPEGDALVLNGDGLLWRLDLADSDGTVGRGAAAALRPVPIEDLPPINNDHVLDPARGLIYLSAGDGQLYVAPIGGGRATRITDDAAESHFLHGVSPDGSTLAYVSLPAGDFSAPGRLALIAAAGGGAPHYLDAGARHIDGPEFSPDGRWILLNTEAFGTGPGHAQLARLPADGGPLEQLVRSGTVDWFPHLSPDGRYATYLEFPSGTLGHPADLDVTIVVVATADWSQPLARVPLFGGQGTLNVNSWAPDSRRFAYVAYPIGDAGP